MQKVQVAFQGGGAKLVNLIAAAHALEEAHNSGKIKITRVAGTSAGSIAACILASGIGVDKARDSLRTSEMRDVATKLSARTRIPMALWSIYRGVPLKSIKPLGRWLSKFLGGGKDSNKRVKEVSLMRSKNQIELLIVSSDIANRGSHVASASELVINAIEASCGIPFAFRTWKDSGYEKVDGGLCANLPVDFLRDDENIHGDVLAVCFDRPVNNPHNNLMGYLMALVDTAISSGEDRARDSLPASNVFSINTNLTTFDFKGAFEKGLSDQYELVKLSAKVWIDEFIDIKNNEALVLAHDPWKDQSVASRQFLSEMGKYFTALEAGRAMNYISAAMEIYAPSLSKPVNTITGNSDRLKLTLRFSTDKEPVHMLSLSVLNVDEHTALDATSLDCKVKDSLGNPVKATLIPMSLAADSLERNVAVCFHTPLPANSEEYSLSYVIRGSQLLRTLQVDGSDIISYFPRGPIASTTVGKVEIIAVVPRSERIVFGFKGDGANPRYLNRDELPLLDYDLDDVEITGCVAFNVPRTEPSDPERMWRLTLDRAISRS